MCYIRPLDPLECYHLPTLKTNPLANGLDWDKSGSDFPSGALLGKSLPKLFLYGARFTFLCSRVVAGALFGEPRASTQIVDMLFIVRTLALMILPGCSVFAQQLLNGSFETNQGGCGINLMNDAFNLQVPHVTAFGGQSEVDLLSATCGFGPAEDGDYLVGLYNNTFSDALAFDLTTPLQAGKLYRLEFAARLGDGVFNKNSKVEIGLSASPTTFGLPVFASPVLDTVWQHYQVQFSPASLVQHFTVRIISTDETWVFLDDFSLECPEVDLGPDTAYCVVESIALEVGDLFGSYQWSDGSTGPRTSVDAPGTYWVEVKDGACTITDTILITEIEGNCDCQIFFPTAFSPNNDGINDYFHPFSPCEWLDFELLIFDRWGNAVYRSTDRDGHWDGTRRGRPVPQGVFAYALRHRFSYQLEPTWATGSVVVVR